MSVVNSKNFMHNIDYTIERDDTSDDKCSKIENIEINNIRLNDIVECIYSTLDPRNNLRDPVINLTFQSLPNAVKKKLGTSMLIYRYCIHRILSYFKIYLDENWDKYTSDDYYSEEVSAICIKKDIAKKIDLSLNQICNLSDDKKIEFILLMEHGRLLPSVTKKTWVIDAINSENLIFSNKALLEKCVNSDLTYLKSYNLPRGLCVKEKHKYRVIDGYHRLSPYNNKKKSVLIVYCEK